MSCAIDGCPHKLKAKGYCQRHYVRFAKYGDPEMLIRPRAYTTAECSVLRCSATPDSRGMCKRHYEAYHRKDPARAEKRREAMKRWARRDTSRYKSGIRNAKRRGLEWAITPEEYAELIKSPCFYDGSPLPPTGSGLDRIDSTKGYLPDNVVPCCQMCNQAKRDMSQEDFYALIKRISERMPRR